MKINPDRLIYPALFQQMDMKKLAAEVGARVLYRPSHKAFEVLYGPIDKFSVYQTEEAKARFVREFEERQEARKAAGAEKVTDQEMRNTATAKSEASKGKSFTGMYGGLEFMLADPEKKPDRHAEQLRDMKGASTEQVKKVFFITQSRIDGLRVKELDARAAALKVPVETLKGAGFAEQKIMLQEAGIKYAGLEKDDFNSLQSLVRGVKVHRALVQLPASLRTLSAPR